MIEKQLISAVCKSREFWEKVTQFDIQEELSEHGKEIYSYATKYYSNDPDCSSVDTTLMLENLKSSYTPKHHELLERICRGIEESEPSVPNVIEAVREIKQTRIAQELSSKLLSPERNGVEELIDKYKSLDVLETESIEDKIINNVPINSIIELRKDENKIQLLPKSLNATIGGGVYRGQNILIYGRPEAGKTLLAINMVRGFLQQGLKVLYIGNEDPAAQLLPRFVASLAGRTFVDVVRNASEAEGQARASGYERLYLAELSPGTFKEIEVLCDSIRPDVVVFDQLRNIYAGKCDKVEQLERVATNSRNLAKSRNVVCVGITQAGASAENKLVLDMGDVDFSNTGMPAQMDLMIGVGADTDALTRNVRCLSLAKNKLNGNHSFITVLYDIPKNRVIST